MWIPSRAALDACGDYADLANRPASPKTDYFDLGGRSLTGTYRRAVELADESPSGSRPAVPRIAGHGGVRADKPADREVSPREDLEEHETRMRRYERDRDGRGSEDNAADLDYYAEDHDIRVIPSSV